MEVSITVRICVKKKGGGAEPDDLFYIAGGQRSAGVHTRFQEETESETPVHFTVEFETWKHVSELGGCKSARLLNIQVQLCTVTFNISQ